MPMAPILFGKLFIFEIVAKVFAVLENGGLYSKVPNIFPNTTEAYCLLGKQSNPGISNHWYCPSLCSKTPSCRLACIDGDICYLFSAYVSSYWNSSSLTETQEFSGPCYSSWYFSSDLTTKIKSVSTAEAFVLAGVPLVGIYTVDGYYCDSDELMYSCSASYETPGWIEVDFGSSVRVTRIVVVMRNKYATVFNNVEVRVGNNTGDNGNFSTNAFFGLYQSAQEAPIGTVVTFTKSTPLYGRYVSICNLDNTYLVVADFKIIG